MSDSNCFAGEGAIDNWCLLWKGLELQIKSQMKMKNIKNKNSKPTRASEKAKQGTSEEMGS